LILLDTHVLLWMLLAPENLTPKSRKVILVARKSGPLALSAISLWEIAWLIENRRIEIATTMETFVRKCASHVEVLPITPEIAVRAVQFPASYPRDPQDRIIGSTAIVHSLRLLTHDKQIAASRLIPLAE
jgi:PIN domain nuclease of toxin-antitoxin system